MTEETTLYSGELSNEAYGEISEVVEDFPTAWIDADVDVILESNGEDRLRINGPETRSMLKPWDSREVTETYELEGEAAEYLQQAFQ